MMNKFVIMIFFGSVLVLAKIPEKNNNYNGHQWYFGSHGDDAECRITAIKPRIFLATSGWISSVYDEYRYDMRYRVNWMAASGSIWPTIATVGEKNIFKGEEIDKFFNKTRSVGMIITDQPVVPFSIKSNFTKTAADLFLEHGDYFNKRKQIVHLNKDPQDLDFNQCSVPLIGTYRDIQVGPCRKTNETNDFMREYSEYITCPYNASELVPDSKWQLPGSELFCKSIKNPDKKFLVGVLCSWFEPQNDDGNVYAADVSDMWEFVDKKWKELYPTAPEESEEFKDRSSI